MKALLIPFLLLAVAAQDAPPTFTDEERGFSIPIPEDWSITRRKDKVAVFAMKSPDASGANFNLRFEDPLTDLNDGKMTWDDVIDSAKKLISESFENVKVHRKEVGKCSGHTAVLVEWSLTYNKVDMKMLQYVVSSPETQYVLTWAVKAGSYDDYKKNFEKYSKAFKISKKK